MNILAIDSSGTYLSAAVSRGEEILFVETKTDNMKHSELVMDMIDSLLKKAALKPADLNGCLCMGGPGSFTGLRIGYSIAKGLSLSLSIPFAPVPTLDCVAFSCASSSPRDDALILPVIQAGKNTFYSALFRGEKRLKPDTDSNAAQIAETICGFKNENVTIAGPAASLLYDSLPPDLKTGIAIACENTGFVKQMILIAKKQDLFQNDNTAFLYSGPEYVRKTDAEINNPHPVHKTPQ
ncbi:MAG: tRNA (adenosine(37)-N6)-threonylcarbamoyltransferase complex dimerization subunit type 1 TsaB [Treponema sp.]|jgi:tRNA threonylcarbamoyladenosine biosynthesis protein TsaB|nr:tRNA (adenosine(37)-N6)-threonylcarbamoyltransferase complex dimerization subunit type 1 TsaB [Treponema sp.]